MLDETRRSSLPQGFKSLYERERIAKTICSELNNFIELKPTLQTVISFLKELTGIEAISIRLHDEGDYPYYIYEGFPQDFIQRENILCARDRNGRRVKNPDGEGYLLECMCGNIIRGRFDPSQEFFTEKGSFWSNNTSELLRSSTVEDRQSNTRNYCNSVGYESVALIPIKAKGENLGLIQLNDKRIGIFTEDLIYYLEMIGEKIGLAVKNSLIFSKLQEAFNSTNFFFSIIAHDIIGPFSTLTTFLEFLDQNFDELNQGDVKKHISRIYRSSRSVYELLDNLFTWSSIQRESFVLEPEKVDLKSSIDEIFEGLYDRASTKEITLQEFVPEKLTIQANKESLKTVIRNLLSNAIKFTEPGGIVTVSGLMEENRVKITVKDTGVGIDSENLANLFTFNPQKKRKGTKGERGAGLGLLICQQLLKKMEGSLNVKSDLGRGSEFIITLST
ncbi:MAG: GAF domain-containing sensor histidine kinase [Candidatus Heimdallarchaeota archaeon]|nr:MAG: GAF domain-containing sensor histidine kinase [Candidatus Heimdallarchaeota archaeon]